MGCLGRDGWRESSRGDLVEGKAPSFCGELPDRPKPHLTPIVPAHGRRRTSPAHPASIPSTRRERYHRKREGPQMLKTLLIVALSAVVASSYLAFADEDEPGCSLSSQVVAGVQSQLAVVVQLNNGGIFQPKRMWPARRDRHGRPPALSAVGDASAGCPGNAVAQCPTRNNCSNDRLARFPARLC